ncbi:unnamed protein product [Linum trigynum]|uniref:Pentatricopeptide repeat-containing protein n=1 Tax=Linum trigynum TaxID=586398 RepID=A0AAV2C916_9ROSI
MYLYRLLRRPSSSYTFPAAVAQPLIRALHHLSSPPAISQPLSTPAAQHSIPSSRRTFAFSSAEEAAAERRRRKRRLRIEPPLHALQRNPNPPPRDPNAPRLPDTTSALVGPRLSLHNKVQSLIRAFDLDAASYLARTSIFSRTRPTVFTCNAIIAAMYRSKRYDDAIALFKYFYEQNDVVPNVVSYNNLINAYCDQGRVDTGLEVYRHIIENAPFSPSPVTYRHLTKGLIDVGRIEEAVDMLREMLTRGHGADSLVFNNVIKGFLELGNLDKANEFFDELKQRCLVYDGVVSATFMDWWFKQGNDSEAMESYRSLKLKKFRMVPATCNVLLEVLLRYGKKEAALELFEEMLDNHTPPTFQAVDAETFNLMVNECFKEGKFAEAVDTFTKAGTNPKSRPFTMTVPGFNNIIMRFAENGMMTEAEQYFTTLMSRSLAPDVTSFKILIEAYLKLERFDDALRIFDRMVESGLWVVAGFGTRVFSELIKNGKAVESTKIMINLGMKTAERMADRDIKPDHMVYDAVVRGLCDAGELDGSRDVLDQMMAFGVGLHPSLKEFALKAFEDAGRGEEIKKLLDENQYRNTSRPPPFMAKQLQSPFGASQFASEQQSLEPSSVGGQSILGQPRYQQGGFPAPSSSYNSPGQPVSGSFGTTGQQTSYASQPPSSVSSMGGQIVSPHGTTGQQPSVSNASEQPLWSSGVEGQQSSWSPHVQRQQSSSWSLPGQGQGQPPAWSSPTQVQQTSWSATTQGQQPSSWSLPGQGQPPSRSSPTQVQQTFWSATAQGQGQPPAWSSPTQVQQKSWSATAQGQQPSSRSLPGQEQPPSWSSPTQVQQTSWSATAQGQGQPPSWSSPTQVQQKSWSATAQGQQPLSRSLPGQGQPPSWSSPTQVQQTSWSATTQGQQPSSWSSPGQGQGQPASWSTPAQGQLSSSPPVQGQHLSWSSSIEGLKSSSQTSHTGGPSSYWSSPDAGQQQQSSWSSPRQQSSSTPDTAITYEYASSQSARRNSEYGSSFNSSPAAGNHHPHGHSHLSGQDRWQDNQQRFDPMARQQQNGFPETARRYPQPPQWQASHQTTGQPRPAGRDQWQDNQQFNPTTEQQQSGPPEVSENGHSQPAAPWQDYNQRATA